MRAITGAELNNHIDRHARLEQARLDLIPPHKLPAEVLAHHGVTEEQLRQFDRSRKWVRQVRSARASGAIWAACGAEMARLAELGRSPFTVEVQAANVFGVVQIWTGVEWVGMTPEEQLTVAYYDCSAPCPPWCTPCANCPQSAPQGFNCLECC